MRPNDKALALRDPALAVLTGAIDGADFGNDYGDDYGDDYGYEFGDDYGYEFGAAAAAPPPPHPAAATAMARHAHAAVASQAMQKAWATHQKRALHTQKRVRLLEPNSGSQVKVERYTFSITQALVIGTPAAISASGQPDTNIRPQRMTMNAPSVGFATISEVKVANVSISVGGILDAFTFNPNAVGQHLDMPTLSPANRATVLGNYTGFVPPGFVGGAAFTFVTTFNGPASIVA